MRAGAVQAQIKRIFLKRFPIFNWARSYKREHVLADAIAGFTVGLTVIPQSIGLAALAGLPPEYGLYSSFIGCFIYVIFGSCRQAAIGPSSLMCLIVFQTCGSNYPECVAWICLYTGIIQFLMACLQVGVLVNFVSEPVIVGYTSGASVIAIIAQIRKLLGMAIKNGSNTTATAKILVQNVGKIQLGDSLIGLGSILFLIFLKHLREILPVKLRSSEVLVKGLWTVSLLRNALVVILTALLGVIVTNPPWKLTGVIQSGLPYFHAPPATLSLRTESDNGTVTQEPLTYLDTWRFYGGAPAVAALIGVMQNIAISKAFASGQSVDATQEMCALGYENVVASFVGAMPTCGSFSRSAVNEASGVQSTLSGFFTGTMVVAALIFLTPAFYYIPQAVLAAIIITAVSSMIDYGAMAQMWRISRADFIICCAVFVISIFVTLETAIGIGVILSLISFLYKSVQPKLTVEVITIRNTETKYLLVKPQSDIYFQGIDTVRNQVDKSLEKHPEIRTIVMDMEVWKTISFTSVLSLVKIQQGIVKSGRRIILLRCHDDWSNAFKVAKMDDVLLCSNETDVENLILPECNSYNTKF